jgi:DNA-binding winged helix-turn-helix (wHTH) protein
MDHIVHRGLRFDYFALDLARGCLRDGDEQIDLRPKAFEVLCYLAENAGRLVLKQELFEAVWAQRHRLGDRPLQEAAASRSMPSDRRGQQEQHRRRVEQQRHHQDEPS